MRTYDGSGTYLLLDHSVSKPRDPRPKPRIRAKGDKTFCEDKLRVIMFEDGINPSFWESVLSNGQFSIQAYDMQIA